MNHVVSSTRTNDTGMNRRISASILSTSATFVTGQPANGIPSRAPMDPKWPEFLA